MQYNPIPTQGETRIMINPMQKKVLSHLTANDGSRDLRRQALEDLIERGAFHGRQLESSTRAIVINYIDENPRDFCASGIQRFKDALGMSTRREVHVLVKLVVEDISGIGVVGGHKSQDGGIVADFVPKLNGTSNRNVKVVGAQWLDYHAAVPKGSKVTLKVDEPNQPF